MLISGRKKRELTRLLLAEALHTRDGSHGGLSWGRECVVEGDGKRVT